MFCLEWTQNGLRMDWNSEPTLIRLVWMGKWAQNRLGIFGMHLDVWGSVNCCVIDVVDIWVSHGLLRSFAYFDSNLMLLVFTSKASHTHAHTQKSYSYCHQSRQEFRHPTAAHLPSPFTPWQHRANCQTHSYNIMRLGSWAYCTSIQHLVVKGKFQDDIMMYTS